MFKWLLVPSMIKDLQYDRKEACDLGCDVHHRLCSVLFCRKERQPFSKTGVTRPIVMKPELQTIPIFVYIKLAGWDHGTAYHHLHRITNRPVSLYDLTLVPSILTYLDRTSAEGLPVT